MVANEGRPEWQRAVKTGRDPETTSSAHQHGQLRRRGSLYCVWRFVGVGHDNGSDRPARRFARTIPAGRPSSTLRRSFLRSPPSRCARTRPSPPSRPLQTRQPPGSRRFLHQPLALDMASRTDGEGPQEARQAPSPDHLRPYFACLIVLGSAPGATTKWRSVAIVTVVPAIPLMGNSGLWVCSS